MILVVCEKWITERGDSSTAVDYYEESNVVGLHVGLPIMAKVSSSEHGVMGL